MISHLSEDQIARCIVSQATSTERQHARECPECTQELNRFGAAMSLFENSIRERIDDRIAVNPSIALSRPPREGVRMQRWILAAAAAAVLVLIPFIRTGNRPEEFPEPLSAEMDPDAVMNRVNLHLARTIPSPMQPLLLGLPKEYAVESGGNQ